MVTVPSSYIVFCEPGSSLLAKTTGDFMKHSLSAQRCLEVKCECAKFKGHEKSGFDWQRIESGVFTPSLGAYHPFFFVVLFSAVKLTTLGQINIYFHFTLSTFQSLYFFFPFTWLKMFSQYFYRRLFQSQLPAPSEAVHCKLRWNGDLAGCSGLFHWEDLALGCLDIERGWEHFSDGEMPHCGVPPDETNWTQGQTEVTEEARERESKVGAECYCKRSGHLTLFLACE